MTDTRSSEMIDGYIRGFPAEVRAILESLRSTIRAAAPGAEEAIKYRVPTFVLQGNLVHFAAHPNHIGFYPEPTGIAAFRDELAGYESAKGSVQFPIHEPLPLELIARIVRFRVAENEARHRERKARNPRRR
jgi:uncharacterized protein YdhG (YjbR/CyaY superfamily)